MAVHYTTQRTSHSQHSQVAELVDALETTCGNHPNDGWKRGSNGNAPLTGSNPVLTTKTYL